MRVHFSTMFGLLLMPALAVRAAEPSATRPTVPALIVGTPPPKSFVVNGIIRFSPTGGMAFHVATDGVRQVCAAYDPADGTPLFLSDGWQTLVYDLANSRVVRVSASRGNVRVDWERGKEKPLSFNFSVDFKSKPEKLEEANAWFRIDRFVEGTTALKYVGKRGRWEVFAAERGDGGIESLWVEPGDPSEFRFTSTAGGASFHRLELNATKIDEPVPDAALAFPDPNRLPSDVNLTDLDEQALATFLRDGRAWMVKMTLAAGPEGRNDAERVMPDVDWDALQARDATFGAAYRKALEEQGVKLPTYPSGAATKSTR
jgi:hypothetical protein